jgi:hypothetical protein
MRFRVCILGRQEKLIRAAGLKRISQALACSRLGSEGAGRGGAAKRRRTGDPRKNKISRKKAPAGAIVLQPPKMPFWRAQNERKKIQFKYGGRLLIRAKHRSGKCAVFSHFFHCGQARGVMNWQALA